MGKYIKKFNTVSEYEAYVASEEYLEPNISYVAEIGKCSYTYEGGVIYATYNVTTTDDVTRLFADAFTTKASKMILDGEELRSPLSRVKFTSKGTHNVELYFGKKLSTLDNLFADAITLTSVDVANLVTDEVTSMFATFNNCNQIKTLNVAKWDMGKCASMKFAFQNCTSLKTIEGIENWNTPSLTDMSYTFTSDSNLLSLDLSGWDLTNVTTMEAAFSACVVLTTCNLPNNAKNIQTLLYTWLGCSELTSLDMRGWDTSKLTDVSAAIGGCIKLATLYMDGNVSKVATPSGSMFGSAWSFGTFYYNGNYDYSLLIEQAQADYWKVQDLNQL